MRPPRLLKAAAVVGFAATLALITAVPARAHAGGGAEPSNYRIEVTSQPAPGVAVDLGVGGQWIRVTGRTGVAVTVLGYAGEPFLRIRSGHVAVNRHSTTAADNPRLSPVPVQPDTSTAPQWVDAGSGNGVVVWSDDRLTGGSGGRSGEQGTWTLPVQVDGAEATITGTWTRVPAPSPWAWGLGLVAVALAVCGLGWLSRPYRPAALVLGAGGAANAAHLIVGALGPHGGSAVSAWGAALGLGALCWPLVAVGVVSAWRRGEHAGFAVAVAGAVLAVVTGPGDLSVLWHSQLPFPGPPALERALVVVAFGTGVGVVVAGIRILRGMPLPEGPYGDDEQRPPALVEER